MQNGQQPIVKGLVLAGGWPRHTAVLAAIPDRADVCLAQARQLGYDRAAVIGADRTVSVIRCIGRVTRDAIEGAIYD